MLTGAAGMVGRNVVETRPRDWTIVEVTRDRLDLLDAAAVHDAVRLEAPDLLIHAAGRVGGIAANIAAPKRFLTDNVRIGLNVLEAADALGVRVLNLASSCIYPPDAPSPLTEDMVLAGRLEPTNEAYALAKITVLRYGQFCNQVAGKPLIKSLIPCNLYGRHDRFDPLTAHLVPAIIVKLHEAARTDGEVEIWGDGSARREFLYATDFARMLWHAAENFDDLPDVMNLGVGSDHSVLDYYAAAAEVVGWRGRFRFDTARPVGMKRKLVDVRHQQRLAFPLPESLYLGLRHTYDFYRGTLPS